MKRITPLSEQPALTGPRRHLKKVVDHPFGVPVLVFVGLALLGTLASGWLLWQQRTEPQLRATENFIVIVHHDGERQTVPTNEKTVGDFLKRMHIEVAPTDRVEPATDQPITTDNFLINVYRSAPITIIDGQKELRVQSAAATPRSAAVGAGMDVQSEDTVVSAPTDNFVTQTTLGTRTVIARATPITLQLYGKPLNIRTHAATVADLLKEKRVKPTKDDTLKPAVDTPITAGITVAVVRNGIQTITVEEEIPAPVQTVLDTSLSFGSQAVRQEGSAGKRTSTYEIRNEKGVEVSRKLLQSVTITEPVTRIVAKGSTSNVPADKQAVMAAAGISPSDYAYVDYIFSRESRWNAAAVSSNGYYGLGQTSLSRISTCPNWQSNPVCQTQLFTSYAGRYGGWEGAYNFWVSHQWW